MRCTHPQFNYDIWVELVQHRMGKDGHIVDCLWMFENQDPMPIEIQKSHLERAMTAVEISRVFSSRSRYREITYEDQDKFADKKRFVAYQ